MGEYTKYNAENVLAEVERLIEIGGKFRITEVCEPLSIFDWWKDWLSVAQLKSMRQFLKEAIKLGYTGYVCFKVGAEDVLTVCGHTSKKPQQVTAQMVLHCTEASYQPTPTGLLQIRTVNGTGKVGIPKMRTLAETTTNYTLSRNSKPSSKSIRIRSTLRRPYAQLRI